MLFLYVLFFSHNIFFDRNMIKVKRRLERLLIPYIIWPLLAFVTNNCFEYNNKISLYYLKMQFLLGRQFMVPLWYLFSMIFLTIFYFILSCLFKSKFLFIIQLLCLFSYVMQYSNCYSLLDAYNNNVKKPILDTLSILPLCSIGLIFATSKIIENLKINKKKVLFFSYIFIYFLFKYNIFLDLGGYNGIINIFSSIFFFVGFYLLPLEYTHNFIQKLIKQMTSFTNGIYCLQSRMIPFVKSRFYLVGTFKGAIIIYLVSYLFSFIGAMICGKTKLKYLFI